MTITRKFPNKSKKFSVEMKSDKYYTSSTNVRCQKCGLVIESNHDIICPKCHSQMHFIGE